MKRESPAAERNKTYIFQALNPHLPPEARVLEVASGTGQHAAHICQKRPDIVWHPTDPDPVALLSIEAYRQETEVNSSREAIPFDICDDLPMAVAGPFDVIVNINMIHISPFRACQSLLNRASRLLKKGGVLYFYGPFFEKDKEAALSNLEFDRSLRERNPEWGIRSLETVVQEAGLRGFQLLEVIPMPAQNLSVIFKKQT